jgi:hypothetical protein
MRVEEIVTRDVITVRPETTVQEATAPMVAHGALAFWGVVDTETLARTIDGVARVENHLVVRRDAPYLYWV